MEIKKVIRDRRMQLGLQETAVAKRAGLSIHEYGDIEQHADEFETAISTRTARNLSHVLGLKLRNLLELPEATREINARLTTDLIRAAREKQKLSYAQLADRIGFEEETIRSSESTPGYVDTLPIVVIRDLENALGLERGALIQEDVLETGQPG